MYYDKFACCASRFIILELQTTSQLCLHNIELLGIIAKFKAWLILLQTSLIIEPLELLEPPNPNL